MTDSTTLGCGSLNLDVNKLKCGLVFRSIDTLRWIFGSPVPI